MINLIDKFIDKESANPFQENFSRNDVKFLLQKYDILRNDTHIQKRSEQNATILELKERLERYENKKENRPRVALRCVAVFGVFIIMAITHLYFAVKRCIQFVKYGGEFALYEKDEYKSINDIYLQLKKQNHAKESEEKKASL